MVRVSGTTTTPRLDLGEALQEYDQKDSDFIGTKILSVRGVPLKAATFKAVTRESATLDHDTKRGPKGNYNRISFEIKEKNYSCEEHGLEESLGDDERALYATDFEAELETAKSVLNAVKRMQEKRIAADVFNTATWAGGDLYTIAGTAWTNTTATIIKNVRDARRKVKNNSGINPNAIVFNGENLDSILDNTEIKNAIKYTARLTEAEIRNALADLFGVRHVFVGDGIRNTAKKGKAFSGGGIWSNLYAMLAVVAEDGQSFKTPSVGRTILWESDSPDNVTVEEYREDPVRGDIFRVRQNTDEKIIEPYFAHLIKVR